MDNSQKLKEQVQEEFANYLTKRGYRLTRERSEILDYLYSQNKHFTMDDLHQSLHDENIFISKATVYNTMDLLLDCGLMVRHQFGTNAAVFECAYGNGNHNHLICTTCGKVTEIDLGEIFKPSMRRKIRKFSISYYSMYIYGTCSKCAYLKRLELSKLKRKAEKAEAGKKNEQKKKNNKTKQ